MLPEDEEDQGSREWLEYPKSEEVDEEARQRFLVRYPMDERAMTLLLQLPAELQTKVMETFDPRNKEEVDYSRQVTGFIRSLRTQEEVFSRKRAREEEEEDAAKRLRGFDDFSAPAEEEIRAFRERYPMDERAYEYLTSSPGAAQFKVLSEFKPRQEGESDYSSLITSLVKKARQVVNAGFLLRGSAISAPPQGLANLRMRAGLEGGAPGVRMSGQGPSLEQLREFRARFPMDERAWEFLLNANGAAQEVIIKDFKPRRFDDADYSAPVTAFVRSMTNRSRAEVDMPPCPAKLELFRERFPMDDRAFQYLCNSSGEMQREVLERFSPKNMEETDYSRQMTSFLNRGLRPTETPGVGVGFGPTEASKRRIDWRKVPDIREVSTQRPGRLHGFRAQYPMDDRAFDYLQQADPEVQEIVLTEFQPKRRHFDSDYSASVTSYVKAVKLKVQQSHGHGPVGQPFHAQGGGGEVQADAGAAISSGEQALLDGFRRRYPMDERAFQYLCTADTAVKQRVIESFRPKFEGEADYSGLITSFIRSCKR
mmetsp:Transcript_50351/g.117471  ORF Transcript_50351/g.117471 Transcript_50351/m.117471 type:complete len:539 (-) Transcript_50351:45-1661(-)